MRLTPFSGLCGSKTVRSFRRAFVTPGAFSPKARLGKGAHLPTARIVVRIEDLYGCVDSDVVSYIVKSSIRGPKSPQYAWQSQHLRHSIGRALRGRSEAPNEQGAQRQEDAALSTL